MDQHALISAARFLVSSIALRVFMHEGIGPVYELRHLASSTWPRSNTVEPGDPAAVCQWTPVSRDSPADSCRAPPSWAQGKADVAEKRVVLDSRAGPRPQRANRRFLVGIRDALFQGVEPRYVYESLRIDRVGKQRLPICIGSRLINASIAASESIAPVKNARFSGRLER